MAELFFTVKVELIAHAKWQRLMALGPARGGAAAALWLAMMARTSEEQQGGRVAPAWPSQELRGWASDALRQASADLVAAGLWEVADGGEADVDGWEIHDFLEHQGRGAGVLGARRPAITPVNETKEERAKRLSRERSRRAYQKRTGQTGDTSVRSERENGAAERESHRERERENRETERERREPDSHADRVDSHGGVSRFLTLSEGDSHASPSSLQIRDRDSSDARERENVREREDLTESESNALTLSVGFAEVVRATIAKAYRDRDLKLPPECALGTGHHPRVMAIAKALEDAVSLDTALRGFFATPKVAAHGYPLRFIENNPNEYLLAGRAMAGSAPQPPTGASSTSRQGSATHLPPYAPGGAQAVTSKSLPELVELMVRHTRREMGDALTPAAEVLEHEAHRAKWEGLAIWCCSRTARSRQLGNAGYTPGKAWARALHGWLNRTASRGRGEQWVMGGLISDPEGCWEDGADQ